MKQGEVCARNVSAAIREAQNALNAAELDRIQTRTDHGEKRQVDDGTYELLKTAKDSLELAAARLAGPWGTPRKP